MSRLFLESPTQRRLIDRLSGLPVPPPQDEVADSFNQFLEASMYTEILSASPTNTPQSLEEIYFADPEFEDNQKLVWLISYFVHLNHNPTALVRYLKTYSEAGVQALRDAYWGVPIVFNHLSQSVTGLRHNLISMSEKVRTDNVSPSKDTQEMSLEPLKNIAQLCTLVQVLYRLTSLRTKPLRESLEEVISLTTSPNLELLALTAEEKQQVHLLFTRLAEAASHMLATQSFLEFHEIDQIEALYAQVVSLLEAKKNPAQALTLPSRPTNGITSATAAD